jgi:hypothetical protein
MKSKLIDAAIEKRNIEVNKNGNTVNNTYSDADVKNYDIKTIDVGYSKLDVSENVGQVVIW